MKNTIKILSICVVIVYVFVGAAFANTNVTNTKHSIIAKSKKILCYSSSGKKLNLEVGENCDSLKKLADSTEQLSRQTCKDGSPICDKIQAIEDAAETAYDDCLKNHKGFWGTVGDIAQRIAQGVTDALLKDSTTPATPTKTTPPANPGTGTSTPGKTTPN
jgi:hypothetical protein